MQGLVIERSGDPRVLHDFLKSDSLLLRAKHARKKISGF